MLIHIDESGVRDALSHGPTTDRSHAAIENLLLAHFQGDHVVSVQPEDIESLHGAALGWSPRARRALDHIDEEFAQIAGLREEVPWSMQLGLGADFAPRVQAGPGDKRVLRASLHAFERSHTTSRSHLLGENATDADLFSLLALLRLAQRGWENLEIVHQTRGAGGHTIASEYARVADIGHIVLAVADTDRRHPAHEGGATYRLLRAAADERPPHQRARHTPTRTAEGLIPISVYRSAFEALHPNDHLRLGVLDRLGQLLRSTPSDILEHAHLKDGIRLHQVDYPESEAEGAYWQDIARKTRRDRCTQPTSMQCKRRADCKCFVVDALGSRALADVVAWMSSKKSRKALLPLFDPESTQEISALCDEVLSWGIAMAPVLT